MALRIHFAVMPRKIRVPLVVPVLIWPEVMDKVVGQA